MIEIYQGKKRIKKGLKEATFQEPFEETMDCCKCGKEARIMLIAAENHPRGPDGWICEMQEPWSKTGLFWPHDCCTVAVYLCTDIDCGAISGDWNQA